MAGGVQVVGLEHLFDDARFASPTERARNQLALKDILEPVFQTAPVDTWIEKFREAGVPHARINDYAAALGDHQVAHMQ